MNQNDIDVVYCLGLLLSYCLTAFLFLNDSIEVPVVLIYDEEYLTWSWEWEGVLFLQAFILKDSCKTDFFMHYFMKHSFHMQHFINKKNT